MHAGPSVRRSSDRSLLLRALVLSLGLHAAAAALYGGYKLSGIADSPPRVDIGGSAWVAITIRAEPGDAGRLTAGEGEPAPRAGKLEAIVAGPVPEPAVAEPAPPDSLPPPPSMLPLVAATAPVIEAAASVFGHTLEDAIEAIANATSPPEPREPDATPAQPTSALVAAATGAENGQAGRAAEAGGGGDAREGHGLGHFGHGDGAGLGDGTGGGDAGVRGLGTGGQNQPPEYPQAARLAGQEGEVVLLALSNAKGAVEQVTIEQSSGFPLLDDAALAAVRGWTFVPALENGVAVAGYVRVPIRFVLRR